MEKYGSQLIKIIKFRDSFVMIGQKGLARGKAIEMVRRTASWNETDVFSPSFSTNRKEIETLLRPLTSVVVRNFPVRFSR